MGFLDEIVEGGLGKPIIGKSIHSFLHPEEAYEDAADELRRQFEEAKGFIQPYQQHGLDQYGNLQGGINSLLNPESLMSRFTGSYETSPYAKQLLGLNKSQGLDAASSMGLMGSSAALGNIQQGAGNIVAQDRQNYINQLMQNYLKGLGLSEGIYNTGANAAESMFRGGQDYGQNMAQMRYNQQAAPGQLFGNLLRTGAQLYGGGMGGGGGFLS